MQKRFLLFLFCASLIFALTSCEGPPGKTGPKGDPGIPGGTITEFTGTIGGDGLIAVVDIGNGPLPPDTTVTVYVADDIEDAWTELGTPTGEGSVEGYPWCDVNYETSEVGFYNCSPDWLYKITVFTPTHSSGMLKRPLSYMSGGD